MKLHNGKPLLTVNRRHRKAALAGLDSKRCWYFAEHMRRNMVQMSRKFGMPEAISNASGNYASTLAMGVPTALAYDATLGRDHLPGQRPPA